MNLIYSLGVFFFFFFLVFFLSVALYLFQHIHLYVAKDTVQREKILEKRKLC